MFEIEGLDELTEDMLMIKDVYQKDIKKFMQKEGNKLKRRTKKAMQSSTLGKKTGNYEAGIKRGKYYKYSGNGADSIRVYSSARHAHLIEEGHEIVAHSGRKAEQKWKHGTGEYTRAFHIFRTAADEFENTYETDCETFALEIIEPLNRGR